MARHTNQLEALVQFYTQLIGLQQMGSFQNHAGYDGVFLSDSEGNWELEFTISKEAPEHQSDEDDLLVFYPNPKQYEHICQQELKIVVAKNPYWNKNAITILDPDGFRVTIVKPI